MRRITIATLLAVLAGPASAWWDFSPYTEHQDLMSRSIDIAAERYPDMAAEVTAYRDQLLSGTHDEDFDSDETNGSYCDYSGYCVAVPGALAHGHAPAERNPVGPRQPEPELLERGGCRLWFEPVRRLLQTRPRPAQPPGPVRPRARAHLPARPRHLRLGREPLLARVLRQLRRVVRGH
jgi:hypothetical protein